MTNDQQAKMLFDLDSPPVVNCQRCGVRCQTVAKRKANASVFVRGDAKTGKFCTNCLVTDFFKNFDLGPAAAGAIKGDFDPECLRLPHIQKQFAAVCAAAMTSYGSELLPDEIDWDEVIANWHLPFPAEKRRRKA